MATLGTCPNGFFVARSQLLHFEAFRQAAATIIARMNRPHFSLRLLPATAAALLMLSACGGGGGGGGSPTSSTSTTPPSSVAPDPIGPDPDALQNICAAPRTGYAPDGTAYRDRQGTILDEMKFLRSWTDANYLWYKEIPSTIHMADYTNVIDYFDALKTPALTAAGTPKDRFHFTYSTQDWDAMTNEGKETGYGVTWSANSTKAPRTWLAAIVEPGSPADQAGVVRGDMLMTIDGVDFVNATDTNSINTMNAGLYPSAAAQPHTFGMKHGTATRTFTMVSTVVAGDPVKNVKVIDTADGKVGYLSFEDHNAVSEKRLVDAFTTFKNAGVKDLVLDMRYNGGGLLYVASELAYMIGGPAVAGKTFEQLNWNDKFRADPPVPFMGTAYGFSSPNPVAGGTPLPGLGLKRVTILTGPDTCSASESVINGLRGVDVEVNLIGGRTCGKPYGFVPVDNCGTTYFSIEFAGVNAKGYGDYGDGFAPTCTVSDDMAHALGDPAESQLAAALAYRTNNACPAGTGARSAAMHLVRGWMLAPCERASMAFSTTSRESSTQQSEYSKAKR